MNTGGGRFDPGEEFIYFLPLANGASMAPVTPDELEMPNWSLVAVNDVFDNAGLNSLRLIADYREHRILLDSGIFWLTQRHCRLEGVTMDKALSLAPENIKDFDELHAAYVRIVKELEGNLWGYIELDQGGAEHKKRTRAALEEMGLRPRAECPRAEAVFLQTTLRQQMRAVRRTFGDDALLPAVTA